MIFSQSGLSRRKFLTGAMTAAGAGLLPKSLLGAPRNETFIQPFSTADGSGVADRIPGEIKPFDMAQVRLLDGPFRDAMETNRSYLHSVPSDRLLHTFLVTAGLPSTAEPLGGWEKPDCELRGHFAGGHYLSACAQMYASTGDDELKAKANAMVEQLARCQKALQTGYLSAFPEEEFDRLRNGQKVWAPFYTIHKIMAGHLDIYQHCGNEQALAVAEGMADWVGLWVKPLSDEHMARILEVEHGGMLEVLCNLYAITGKGQYLYTARRFNHKEVFDPLAEYRDELKGLHTNTNIPKIIGVARRYELMGDERDHDIASYFWQEVVNRRTFCTGGTSDGEHWESDPGNLSKSLSEWDEECCCGYNMLKLTRHIFGWTGDPRAMDYYERTLFNSRLGTQDADGMKSYFVPLGTGYWKYYNTRYDSFWCCTGTGAEEFSKFGDSIYFHGDRGIYVNLLIASELNWPDKGVRLRQETRFPEEEKTILTVQAEQPVEMAMNFRIPQWATSGGTIKVNGEALPVFSNPSSYLSVNRVWKSGDRMELSLPMSLRTEALPGDETRQAVMYGPLVLGGRLGSQGVTKELMYSGYDTAPDEHPGEAPVIDLGSNKTQPWVERVPGQPLSFRTKGQARETALIPFHQIAGEKYVVYWKTQTREA
ncbi:MAG: beta-L-arabinofuranosidase domain-containing protein [Candidatus Acidiferrales bacterium]